MVINFNKNFAKLNKQYTGQLTETQSKLYPNTSYCLDVMIEYTHHRVERNYK